MKCGEVKQMTNSAWITPGKYPSNVRMMLMQTVTPHSPVCTNTPMGGQKMEHTTARTRSVAVLLCSCVVATQTQQRATTTNQFPQGLSRKQSNIVELASKTTLL
eukprot:TRINITY_DN2000_c0_g1_i1.p1 TRINITY_DN2000_c0_g1~~TRINITY_DN2000_c0_g1_i1.p1  ORF type:complete len:104 (-),score=18.62 TRINITY_DN2000_c0_g1_i1:400-711(-)